MKALVILALITSFLRAAEPGVIMLGPGDQFATHLEGAMERVNTGQASVIRFAPGEFLIRQTLEFHIPFGHPGLRLQGSGPGQTKLTFAGVETGIRVRLDTAIAAGKESPSFFIGDLSLIAFGRCGTAVVLEPGDSDARGGVASKVFRDLMIEGRKGTWAGGIRSDDLAFCTFRDITLRLPGKDSTGIQLGGANSPVDHHFSGIRILGGKTGIRVTGTVEGVYLEQITMIGTKTGIDWQTDGPEPLLSLNGSHINARSCCVRAENLLQPVITGNLFYQADSEFLWTGIEFVTERSTPFDLLQISNNTFHGHPKHSKPATGLSIESASDGVIQGNVFSGLDTGIRLGKGASSLQPDGSVFKTTATPISGPYGAKPPP